MNIHEYQAKNLLSSYAIKTPEGFCLKKIEDISKIRTKLELPVVGKVQVHAGGRGKSGGIKILYTETEIDSFVKQFLGKPFKSYQTGNKTLPVSAILFEKVAKIKKELYFAITYDKKTAKLVILCSKFGGVDIEEIAKMKPETASGTTDSILKVYLSNDKVMKYQILDMLKLLELPYTLYENKFTEFLNNCLKLYIEKDATLLEINPLVQSTNDELIALDAKINFDYRAIAKHPEIAEMFDYTQENPNELCANEIGINYIELDGNIGCMVNGAGLAMGTMDLIKFYGGEPANFLDVGGGANKEQLLGAFRILLSNKSIKSILINIFGGILKTDILAESLIESVRELKPRVPIVVRLEGTNVEKAQELLENAKDIRMYYHTSLKEAAKKAIELSNQ